MRRKLRLLALSWTRKPWSVGILIRDGARIVDAGKFTENGSAILDLRLYQLTGLERESIREYDSCWRRQGSPGHHCREAGC